MASPIPENDELQLAIRFFGVGVAKLRESLAALDGSILLLAHDEGGKYWTYKHPTVGDAFSQLVSENAELTEIYLRGAKPEYIFREVVCAGVTHQGAPVSVPPDLYPLLIGRLKDEPTYQLAAFLTYRADKKFSEMLLESRPEILDRLSSFGSPICEDSDSQLLARLHSLGMLPKDLRENFIDCLRKAVIDDADASFIEDADIRSVLTEEEVGQLLEVAESNVLNRIDSHVDRIRNSWERDYDPSQVFDNFENSVKAFARELRWRTNHSPALERMAIAVSDATWEMRTEYEPAESLSAPVASAETDGPTTLIFRDIDD